ncbi:MAG: AEC family transporter [Clostridia bacterium]|nr:AEC family transporter [Clostridia bacterium]
MDTFFIMLKNVIIFALLAVPGYLLVKTKMVKQEQSGILSKILMYIGLPFLILSGTVANLEISRGLLCSIVVIAIIGIGYTLITFFLSLPLSSFEKEIKKKGMIRFCSVFSNNGFLGIPLAIAVFGKETEVFLVLIIINIITNLIMYTIGTYLISGDKKQISIKNAIFNPVLIAFLVGIILNLLKIEKYLTEIETYSNYFSGIVTPISMTILGMKLATVKFSSMFTTWKTYYVSFIKLVVFPMIIVGILFVFRSFKIEFITIDLIIGFFIAFAMPTAGLSTTFADNYGGDVENSVIFTLGSTLLSIITIPSLYLLVNSMF